MIIRSAKELEVYRKAYELAPSELPFSSGGMLRADRTDPPLVAIGLHEPS